MMASNAILAALAARSQHGIGQHVEIAMFGQAVTMLAYLATNTLISGEDPVRTGNAPPLAKYMARRRAPPSQGWETFFRNHADGIAAMDLFVVPTISFRLLYGLLIMGHGRRQVLWLGVTGHPTAEWIAISSPKLAAVNKSLAT